MASPFDPQYSDILNKIRYYANQYGIDSNIGIWQIWQESKFNPNAQSSSGASGIAQFMPATAQQYNVNVWDIDSSLSGWARYMRDLLNLSYINYNYALALAGYNAGQGNVKKYGGIPPFKETKNYVNIILSNAQSVASSMSGITNNVTSITTNFTLVLIAVSLVLLTRRG